MKKKIICALLAIVMIFSVVGVLASCNDEEDPTTKECTKHVDKNKDKLCDNCEALIKHTCKDNDDDGLCDYEGCKKEVKKDDDDDNKKPDDEPDVDYYWEDETLIFQMTHHNASNELSSTCARYLAGEYKGTQDNIDEAVAKRNQAAMDHAKIEHIEYLYYPDQPAYGWGRACEWIMKDKSALDTTGLPDMYVNFIYDMVGASLQGCFHNLYGTSQGQHNNYFPFKEFNEKFYAGEFDEEKEGNGYMYEYMTTLTLSKHKMYLLASDYFTDLVRGFYIVPVNVELLEKVGDDITGDLVGDGDGFTLDDFYEEVWNRNWTYKKLAEYSKAIYSDAGNPGEDFSDTLGFVLSGQGGLSPSGIIYTTNCTIISRVLDKDTEDFVYGYPKENEKFFDLIDAVDDLMKQEGVICITGTAEQLALGNGSRALDAIANRFASGNILFGGVCLLGSLENTAYQEMEGKGFGVVPVPLYSDDIDDKYLTQVHNQGRIGAISIKTKKFEACTAFLNYQSTHSTDIINDYYKYKLQYDIVGASATTIEMLDYIRNNVRSAFDKTFEDAMGMFYDTAGNRWHDVLMRAQYQVDMRKSYSDLYDTKEGQLTNLLKYYDGLPG